jgi:hypothetical protein
MIKFIWAMVFLGGLQFVKNWKIIFGLFGVVFLFWFLAVGGSITLAVLAGK